MDILANVALGLDIALSGSNLLYCFIGVFVGTAIGVLPGLGPFTTISILLPLTFGLPPTAALIMLAGIFYGAQYGGSTTAILVNLPGEASSVVTALDGYKMAQKGRAGLALATAAIGSFVAGTIATLLMVLFTPSLASLALTFQPADYFSLMVLGLVASIVLAHGSLLHAVAMIVTGLLFGIIGSDVSSGKVRFSFGIPELADGLDFVIIAMGIYGLGEIVANLENPQAARQTTRNIGRLMPKLADYKAIFAPVMRGTGLGSLLGILPGGGATLASFAAYSVEKKVARQPEQFGEGAIQGVAGPEAANNAAAQTSFIPMLTLGIPGNPVMALMIGALMIQGIQPGPTIMTKQPELFWGLIASMWIGNLMLLILNLPLVGMWAKLISVPYHLLFPTIMLVCCVGVFSVNNAAIDIYLMGLFGIVGYFFRKVNCEPAPMLLGFILGPMMEEYLRRALLLSKGDPSVFFTRPASAIMLTLSVLLLAVVLLPTIRKTREVAFQE
jgi:putative tricarboxylic transport membrane protein